jgi:hypothetical protein
MPLLPAQRTSAPLARSSEATRVLSQLTARRSGVSPTLSHASMLAPQSSKACATSSLSRRAAMCRGVQFLTPAWASTAPPARTKAKPPFLPPQLRIRSQHSRAACAHLRLDCWGPRQDSTAIPQPPNFPPPRHRATACALRSAPARAPDRRRVLRARSPGDRLVRTEPSTRAIRNEPTGRRISGLKSRSSGWPQGRCRSESRRRPHPTGSAPPTGQTSPRECRGDQVCFSPDSIAAAPPWFTTWADDCSKKTEKFGPQWLRHMDVVESPSHVGQPGLPFCVADLEAQVRFPQAQPPPPLRIFVRATEELRQKSSKLFDRTGERLSRK